MAAVWQQAMRQMVLRRGVRQMSGHNNPGVGAKHPAELHLEEPMPFFKCGCLPNRFLFSVFFFDR